MRLALAFARLMYWMGAVCVLAVLTGCATTKPCTPLSPFYLGDTRIFPVVCTREHINKACRFEYPGLTANACCYRKVHPNSRKQCWIFRADDEAGMKATDHEYAHCAGHDEGGARCDDWPGTTPPPGQECRDGWRRRDTAKEKP